MNTVMALSILAVAVIGFFVCTLFYFMPALIAERRGHRNVWAIFALNAFLGWSMIGWVVALVWSMTAQDERASA